MPPRNSRNSIPGPAIQQKTPLEQQLVTTYADWAAAVSELILPLLESILSEQMIPQYQRAIVAAFPDIAQSAAMEVAVGYSEPELGRGKMLGALWRSSGQLVGGDNESVDPTLPAVDPLQDTLINGSPALTLASQQRAVWPEQCLNTWNYWTMMFFDRKAKMCQFGALWRSFTCGQLDELLNDEYPTSNLPMLISPEASNSPTASADLENHFTFLGVVYWKKAAELMPGNVQESALARRGGLC